VVARATTADDGSWWTALPPFAHAAVLRAVFAGDGGDRPGVISPLAPLALAPAIELSASGESVSGTVRPVKKRVTVTAYSGAEKVKSTRVAVHSDGTFATTLSLRGPGSYRLIATTAADARTAAGQSNEVDVAVQ
jgi:hypothetical protein